MSLGFYLGLVTNNEDPEKLGRIKLAVPGLVEPESNWAWPIGTVGGGGSEVGFYAVPPVGAKVGVFFRQGSITNPFYVAGNWGKPDGVSEAPLAVQTADAGTQHQIRVFESERYSMVFFDVPGQEYMMVRDKQAGAFILLDGPTGQMSLEAPTGISIKSTGSVLIDALDVSINGRKVAPGKKVI